jgi:phenylpropionate dioxygenase-like ring-hydroxylating dioxygenase large terminal subunit
MMFREAAPDVHELVQRDRVGGRLYRDPELFARELERIWYRVWVYLGHESEVPEKGDFVRRAIGLQPVVMVRGEDGRVRAFYNRCRHRGNLVCLREQGNAPVLRCPYHGWSYATSGELIAPTFEEGYGKTLPRDEFGLAPVARIGSYRGLVFASLADEGISLDEHLGEVKEYIDLFMDLSPTGDVELRTGIQKLRYRGNWKMLPENSLEGDYHGFFIHRVAFGLLGRRTGLQMNTLQGVPNVIRSLPGGHMIEDYRGAQMSPPSKPPSRERLQYVAALEARYGPERAKLLATTIPPLIYVFPNLIYIMTHVRRVQPVAVDETFVYYQPLLLKGVPDAINAARLREHEFGFGPAGLISPDDIEIMARNQQGINAHGNDWSFVGRGLDRETELPGGGTGGFTMDENQIRAMWRHYAELMA